MCEYCDLFFLFLPEFPTSTVVSSISTGELACEHRRISGCRFSPPGRCDSRKYVRVRRLQVSTKLSIYNVAQHTVAYCQWKLLGSISFFLILFDIFFYCLKFQLTKPNVRIGELTLYNKSLSFLFIVTIIFYP